MPGVRDVHAVARGEVEHARAPHVLDQRADRGSRGGARRRCPRAARPRSPPRRRSPAMSSTAATTTAAGEDDVGARLLDPGQRRARPRAASARRPMSSSSAARADHHALHAEARHAGRPLRGVGEVAQRAADARRRAGHSARRALDPSGTRASSSPRHEVPAQLLELPSPSPAPCRAGSARSSRPRPRGHEPHSRIATPAHPHELQRAAAELHHMTVLERRRVDGSDVAVASLLLGRSARESADRCCSSARARNSSRLLGVADGAGGHGVDFRAARARWPCRSGRRPRARRARAPSAPAPAARSPTIPSAMRTGW